MEVILKKSLVLALMVALLARRVPLGPVMLAAALALGLLFRMTPEAMGLTAWRSAIDFRTTVYLIIVLYLISVLENLLRTGGMLARMVGALRVILRDHRLVASFMPAFIGFLPSAGGAMFSAPLVREATKDMGLSQGRMTFINYWFRHIWEPVFPLYPGLILAAALACLGLAAGLRYPPRKVPLLLWQAFKPMTLLLIIGVMVFKGMLEASGAVAALPEVLAAYRIPQAFIVFLLPFLTGFLTGISQGYVAVSFPLLLGMMGHPAGDLGWYVLAFISGLFGVYLSPSHLCLVLTREYFGAGWGDVYRRLLPASLAVLALAVALYRLL